VPSAATPNVEDQRPPDQGKQHTLSLGIWDCEYMVTRLSDKKMPIDRIQQLRSEISSALTLAPNDQIVVTNYAVYMNEGAQVAAQASAVAAGAFGGVALSGGRSAPRCPREKMRAGWFDVSETTTHRPPIIAEVTVRFRAKEYSARAAYSPEIATGYYPTDQRRLADRIALYTKVNQLIIAQIQKDITDHP